MVDVTAESGANAIMIDTSILSKVTNVCLIDTRGEGMIDINSLVARNNIVQQGIPALEDLRSFVEYCHYRGVAANVAGSIESYQAQQLWALFRNWIKPQLVDQHPAWIAIRQMRAPLERIRARGSAR